MARPCTEQHMTHEGNSRPIAHMAYMLCMRPTCEMRVIQRLAPKSGKHGSGLDCSLAATLMKHMSDVCCNPHSIVLSPTQTSMLYSSTFHQSATLWHLHTHAQL